MATAILPLALAIAHHLFVFALLGVLVAERTLVGGQLAPRRVRQLGRLDAFYGALAGAILIVGSLRVFFGGRGADFYLPNLVFWAKIAAFVAVGLLSIVPTMRILAWRRSLVADHAFTPAPDDVRRVGRFLSAELYVFPLIPIFAAAMAMGYRLG
jgi:putative membrane protein